MAQSLEKQASGPVRRPVATTLIQRAAVAASGTPLQSLQQRVGSHAMHGVIARSAAGSGTPSSAGLRVSSPGDLAEREATSTAAAVMRAPLAQGASPGAAVSIQRVPAPSSPAAAPAGRTAPAPVAHAIAQSASGGSSLPTPVRGFMEPRFGASFSGVRVHTDDRAASLSAGLSAKAFTVGNHIYFGRNQFQPERREGRELIAHELTHTIQQGGTAQRSIQRDEEGSGVADALGELAGDVADAVLPSPETVVVRAVGLVAPDLAPIIQGGAGGFFEWIKDKALGAVRGVFDRFMAPVNAIAGAGTSLNAQVAPVVQSLQTAAGQIAKNDCGPIRDAADKLEKAAERLITPIVETLQPVVVAIKGFFSGVWDTIGAPIWGWIKDYAAWHWDMLKKVAGWIASAASWVGRYFAAVYGPAWNWLKAKLGIGSGPEEGGILQWVQGKLEEAWGAIKAQLAPFSKQLTIIAAVVGGIVLALSPAGPIVAIAGAIGGAIQGIRWIAANWGKGNIIATARVYLEKTLIPPLVDAAGRLSASFNGLVQSLTGGLNSLAASLMGAVSVVGGSLLSFAVSAIQWIANQATALAAWANSRLANLGAWLTAALGKLQSLLTTVLTFLGRVADVVIDIWALPVFLAEAVWDAVPACVRDPIVDFIGPIILRQIEIFQELAKDNDAWQKTKADVAKIIRMVFHDHDLAGAIKATFFLILRVFNLPPELLAEVGRKALAAWDVVSKAPLQFIKNAVRSVGHGFKNLWDNKIENLKLGLQGWLFGEVKEKNISIPQDWSEPRQLLDLALSVLGLNAEHVFELMKKRFPGPTIDRIRKVVGYAAGVIEWVDKAIVTTKTPQENARGMIAQAKDFGTTVLTGLAEWVVGKIAQEIAIMLAAAAASAGLSEVVDVIRRVYRAILTAVRWARRVLDMVNQTLDNVLDIAGGAVEKVGLVLYKIMQGGLPVIVGFLADQVGLGGVGAAIRGIIDKLREKVDNAILWFIDKIKVVLERIAGAVKAGVAAVRNWWNERQKFTGADGQSHEVYFEGNEANADLMVASRPQQLRTFLNETIRDATDQTTKDRATKARDLYQKILRTARSKNDDDKAAIASDVKSLGALLATLVGVEAGDMPKESDLKKNFAAPTGSSIQMLWKGNLAVGTRAQGENAGYRLLAAAELTITGTRWVRMHLISHQIGGPGTPNNWVMAPTGINTGSSVRGFETSVESLVKGRSANKQNVVWVRVGSTGFHPAYAPKRGRGYAEGDFVSGVNFRAGLYYPGNDKKWLENTQAVIETKVKIPPPSDELKSGVPNVNSASKTQLVAATGATPRFVDEVVRVVNKYGPFSSMAAFSLSMEEHRFDNDTRFTVQFDTGLALFEDARRDGMIRISMR